VTLDPVDGAHRVGSVTPDSFWCLGIAECLKGIWVDRCGAGAELRFAICDDHRLFADALATVLGGRGWRCVACADKPSQMVCVVRDTQVDVCLMDLFFPDGILGLDGISVVRAVSPSTQVVVLTAASDPTTLAQAVTNGAAGVAFKDDDIDRIVEVVECVHGGGVVPNRAAPRPSAVVEPRSQPADLGRFLTPRERETLERLARGESGTQLAQNMSISHATARTHVQHVLEKLGVHSRLEAVAFAVTNNLIRAPNQGDRAVSSNSLASNIG
jgi:two-component system, NarL family, nitrate/nitrite response regulator NarL